MAKFYKLNSVSLEELINLEKACMIICTKLQNEAIAVREQPYNNEIIWLLEIEKKGNKYNKIHNQILNEIENRLNSIVNEEN